jgi:soluble lytic murein transglycosylase-like protein
MVSMYILKGIYLQVLKRLNRLKSILIVGSLIFIPYSAQSKAISDGIVVLRSDSENALISKMQVRSNNEFISLGQATMIVEAARQASVRYKIPVNILLAIAFVESSYKINAINFGSNDYGIMQVNQWHIDRSGWSKQKLLTDVFYAFDKGAKVFEWFYNKYPLDEAIARYNCGTRVNCPSWSKVKKYVAKVKKAM